MTDKEIIKALEGCWLEGNCEYCPMKKDNKCKAILRQIALDLINRKDSKIAELTEENNHQQAEIERLSKKNEELAEILSDTIRIRYAEAKAEAIKEFAERLCEGRVSNDPVVIAVKVELKEMVGDTE